MGMMLHAVSIADLLQGHVAPSCRFLLTSAAAASAAEDAPAPIRRSAADLSGCNNVHDADGFGDIAWFRLIVYRFHTYTSRIV